VITFNALMCNAGPWPADLVAIKFSFSKEVSVYDTSGEGWTCGISDQQIGCQRATLPAGACSPVRTNVVPAPGVDSFLVQASAMVSGLSVDINPLNNVMKTTLSVSNPDMPRLRGGGVGSCTMGSPHEWGSTQGTLAFLALLGVLSAGYRAFRRKSETDKL
jgi:hypothetical protein